MPCDQAEVQEGKTGSWLFPFAASAVGEGLKSRA